MPPWGSTMKGRRTALLLLQLFAHQGQMNVHSWCFDHRTTSFAHTFGDEW
jgi:hypothetical protein